MRSKKAIVNIIASFSLQIVTIICGLIVPRLIIETFGSGINGILSSISQFLGYIVLLESGVGGVVRAALYKPLANKNIESISKIIKATEKFFRIIAYIFIGYLLIVAIYLPYLVRNDFDAIFTFTLVLIIGTSTFFQYYFGISYQILLHGDQKQYILSFLQIFTIVLNTILVVILIKMGFNIQIVKAVSAVVFVIRPILLNKYVNRHYKIIKNCIADSNQLKQKWDGLGHHIAFLLHNNTDIVVLTLFTNIKEVSVYSVYYFVVSGIKKITITFSSSLEAAFGNMIAKGEKEILKKNFSLFEFISSSVTAILFTTAALLILPFVSIYTSGITDVDYNRPMFAYILIFAEAVYCIRVPYSSIVLAAGLYKQTRNGAFAEAIINIVLSVVLVNYLGIVGVVIGTLCSVLIRTVQYVFYLSKHIINKSIWDFIKKNIVFAVAVTIIITIVRMIQPTLIDSYVTWISYAIILTLLVSTVILIISSVFYLNEIKYLFYIIKRLLIKKGL